MGTLFYEANSFNHPIADWNTSSVTDTSYMFYHANSESFNQPVGNWDTISVTGLVGIFSGAGSFNQNLCTWLPNMGQVKVTYDMFKRSTCVEQSDPEVKLLAIAEVPALCQSCDTSPGFVGIGSDAAEPAF